MVFDWRKNQRRPTLDILEKANELGKNIKDSAELRRYREAEARFLNSDEVQKSYNEYKSLYSIYLKNLDESVAKEIDDKYNLLLKNDIFKEYLDSKNHYDKLVSTVYDIIGYHTETKRKNCDGCSGCGKNSAPSVSFDKG